MRENEKDDGDEDERSQHPEFEREEGKERVEEREEENRNKIGQGHQGGWSWSNEWFAWLGEREVAASGSLSCRSLGCSSELPFTKGLFQAVQQNGDNQYDCSL